MPFEKPILAALDGIGWLRILPDTDFQSCMLGSRVVKYLLGSRKSATASG
jgi:hypothetical protein